MLINDLRAPHWAPIATKEILSLAMVVRNKLKYLDYAYVELSLELLVTKDLKRVKYLLKGHHGCKRNRSQDFQLDVSLRNHKWDD